MKRQYGDKNDLLELIYINPSTQLSLSVKIKKNLTQKLKTLVVGLQ